MAALPSPRKKKKRKKKNPNQLVLMRSLIRRIFKAYKLGKKRCKKCLKRGEKCLYCLGHTVK